MKEKLKSYSFWVKIISVLIIIANIITSKFGYSIDSALIFDIATIVATLFVVLGVITEPTGINNKNEFCEVNGVMEQIKKDLVNEVENIVSCIENNDASLLSEILDRIKLKLKEIKVEGGETLTSEKCNNFIAQEVVNEEVVITEEDLGEEDFLEKENDCNVEVSVVDEVVIGEEEEIVDVSNLEEMTTSNEEKQEGNTECASLSYVEINGEKYVAKIIDGRALLEKI